MVYPKEVQRDAPPWPLLYADGSRIWGLVHFSSIVNFSFLSAPCFFPGIWVWQTINGWNPQTQGSDFLGFFLGSCTVLKNSF